MKAGYELDCLVAKYVMSGRPAFYSSFIGEAMNVVEQVQNTHPRFVLTRDRYQGTYSGGEWLCSFTTPFQVFEEGPLSDDVTAMTYWHHPHTISAGETPAHVICLAALQAYGVTL